LIIDIAEFLNSAADTQCAANTSAAASKPIPAWSSFPQREISNPTKNYDERKSLNKSFTLYIDQAQTTVTDFEIQNTTNNSLPLLEQVCISSMEIALCSSTVSLLLDSSLGTGLCKLLFDPSHTVDM
jgi:hypothetical protein